MNKIRIVLALAAFLLLSGCVPTKKPTVEDMYKYCDEGKHNGWYCNYLGSMHSVGSDGFEQSYTEAARLYALGCEFGRPDGCESAAEMYEQGQRIDKNIDQAKYYYQKLCDYNKVSESNCKDAIRLSELPRILSYLNDNKKRKGVKVAEGGLQYEVIKYGAGKVSAEEIGFAEFYVNARLATGFEVASKYKYEEGRYPLSVALNDIPNIKDVVKLMKAGDKYRIYLPPVEEEWRYYNLGLSDVPENEMLILDIDAVSDMSTVWAYNNTEYLGEIGIGNASHIGKGVGNITVKPLKEHLSIYYDQNSGEKGGWYYLLEMQLPEVEYQRIDSMTIDYVAVKSKEEIARNGDLVPLERLDETDRHRFITKISCKPSKDNCVSMHAVVDPQDLRTGYVLGQESRIVILSYPLSNDMIDRIKKIASVDSSFIYFKVRGGRGFKTDNMNQTFYFTFKGFSSVFNKLENAANNFVLNVNANGPLLRYQRDVEAFALPHQEVRDCLVPEYKFPRGYSSDTVASIDSSYDLLRSKQEQCFNDIAKENFKAISDLINQLDGVWEWRRTDFLSGKFSKPLEGFASWSVPSNCAACQSGVADLLNSNHSFLQSIDKARVETIESFREGRLKAIREMLVSKEDDARHKARMTRIKEERATEDAEYTRKSNEELRGQPSDGEVFLQELSNTVRQIDERARRRKMQEMQNLSRQIQYEKQQTESSGSQNSTTSTRSENREGSCGSSPVAEFCAPDSPKPCNTCSEYQPWKDRWDAKCAARNAEHRAKQEAWARSCTSTENRPVLTKQK